MVVPWWYWGCVNLYSPPTTTTIRTTFHHPIHSYWGATFVPPPVQCIRTAPGGTASAPWPLPVPRPVVPLPACRRSCCRAMGIRAITSPRWAWRRRGSAWRGRPQAASSGPDEDGNWGWISRSGPKLVCFSFWRGEYVRALQWENLWKPNILC